MTSKTSPASLGDMPALPQRHSLAVQTAACLEAALRAGEWTGHLPGERELCARLQVSRPVLRAALEVLQRQGWLEVAQGRRRRILKQARPGAIADRRIIGMLSPLPQHAVPPFMLFWIDEVRKHLNEAGYQLEFHQGRACYQPQPARALENLVCRAPAAAWVLHLSTEPMQRWFAARGIASLVSGSALPGIPLASVDFDYRAVCRHAAGYLRGKGRRRLTLLLPDGGFAGDDESERGFREGLENSEAIVVRHDGTVPGLCSRLDGLLARQPRPDALLVGRSNYALTTVSHLARRGVRIPEEMAVMARDDDAFLDAVVPRVTRYACEPQLYARKIFRALMALVQKPTMTAQAIRIVPELVRGQSA